MRQAIHVMGLKLAVDLNSDIMVLYFTTTFYIDDLVQNCDISIADALKIPVLPGTQLAVLVVNYGISNTIVLEIP